MQRIRDWFGDGSVLVLDVPLACCALESQAAGRSASTLVEVPAGSRLVVALSGTITHAVAPSLRAMLDALPVTPVVISFGACACVGGPYWDSYAVAKGAADLGITVDHFIPGCPPPPEALTAVLETLRNG